MASPTLFLDTVYHTNKLALLWSYDTAELHLLSVHAFPHSQ